VSCIWRGSACLQPIAGYSKRLALRNGRLSINLWAEWLTGSFARPGTERFRHPLGSCWIAAFGVWMQELRIILLHAGHAKLAGLDEATYEAFVARTAWHEWGHALSVARCSQEDIAAGRRLLDLAPDGVREGIRGANYRPNAYRHELVAETYALLIARRGASASGGRRRATSGARSTGDSVTTVGARTSQARLEETMTTLG
jgi:hypothetical protein